MIKHYNELFDETSYTETLDNGLKVIIFHKPGYSLTSACFGTAFGGLNICQRHNARDYSFHPGTAHFLEHKLFESEEKDIMTAFSLMGANVNAFTSYKETVYYFTKSGEDIKDCLNLLLDFVQNLSITKESVEKEKGIIVEEVSMYMQNPDSRLINETYKSLYEKYPLKYDIGGDEESVMAITKEELEECYSLNYHPSNMILSITTPLDPNLIIDIVKENQNRKSFIPIEKPLNIIEEESEEVYRKEYSFNMDISSSKSCYAIKLKPDFKSEMEAYRKEWAVRLYLNAYFSNLNPDYQLWLDKGIINDYFGFETDFSKDYANIIFYIEGQDAQSLKKLIDEELKKDLLNEEMIEQIKRRYLGMSFRLFNDIDGFNSGYIRDLLEDLDFFEEISTLMNLTYEEVTETFSKVSFDNYALINIFPRGK